jgi:hypothetical protein
MLKPARQLQVQRLAQKSDPIGVSVLGPPLIKAIKKGISLCSLTTALSDKVDVGIAGAAEVF